MVGPPLTPHAAVAVDLIILSVRARALQTLLVKLRTGPYAGRWSFPGGLVGVRESLDGAAARELQRLTSRGGAYMEQLRTFGDPDRDPRARVVSTAYLALLPRSDSVRESEKYGAARWWRARRLPRLAYDHAAMARCALDRLRAKVEYTNIVYGLLPRTFTLSELQEIYEIIVGHRLDRRNFRKKLLGTKLLCPLAAQRRGPHRPATLYRFTRRRLMTVEML